MSFTVTTVMRLTQHLHSPRHTVAGEWCHHLQITCRFSHFLSILDKLSRLVVGQFHFTSWITNGRSCTSIFRSSNVILLSVDMSCSNIKFSVYCRVSIDGCHADLPYRKIIANTVFLLHFMYLITLVTLQITCRVRAKGSTFLNKCIHQTKYSFQ